MGKKELIEKLLRVIIFADEPTSALDHKNALDVYRFIKDYNKDLTLVMATHDMSILNGDERIININDYKVLCY